MHRAQPVYSCVPPEIAPITGLVIIAVLIVDNLSIILLIVIGTGLEKLRILRNNKSYASVTLDEFDGKFERLIRELMTHQRPLARFLIRLVRDPKNPVYLPEPLDRLLSLFPFGIQRYVAIVIDPFGFERVQRLLEAARRVRKDYQNESDGYISLKYRCAHYLLEVHLNAVPPILTMYIETV